MEEKNRKIITGLVSQHLRFISPFFSVSGKVFSVTPLLSSVFVHRVFDAYFDGFQEVGECVDFSGGHSRIFNGVEVIEAQMVFWWIFEQNVPLRRSRMVRQLDKLDRRWKLNIRNLKSNE